MLTKEFSRAYEGFKALLKQASEQEVSKDLLLPLAYNFALLCFSLKEFEQIKEIEAAIKSVQVFDEMQRVLRLILSRAERELTGR